MKNLKKNILAAVLSLSILGTSLGVCQAMAIPDFCDDDYTTCVDRNVCYTGMIIDCRGLGLKPAMSPVVEDTAGKKLYGDKDLDYNVVTLKGAASYAQGFDDEQGLARAGSNPIVLKAVGLTHNSTYPVLSQADGVLVEYSIAKNNYMKNYAVVFIR